MYLCHSDDRDTVETISDRLNLVETGKKLFVAGQYDWLFKAYVHSYMFCIVRP